MGMELMSMMNTNRKHSISGIDKGYGTTKREIEERLQGYS